MTSLLVRSAAAEFVGTPFGALSVCLAALLTCLVWLGLYPLRRWRYRHFPGPLGLPFLGNLPQIAAMDATHYLAHVGRKYGPVCKVWFGTRPWLVVSDPDLVRKLASQSTARALDLASFLGLITGEYRAIEQASVFYAHGEVWRRGRRAFEASIVHPASLAGHLPAILRVLGRFVPSLERYASSGQPLDAQRAVGDLMLAITGELAYGVDFEVDFDPADATAPKPQHGEEPQQLGGGKEAEGAGCGGGNRSEGGVGARLAGVARDIFETSQMENASAYLPLQLVFPSLAPAIRWVATVLPDANQRRIMAAIASMTAVSRQLMAQWAAAKRKGHEGEAHEAEAAAGAGGAANGAATNGGGIHAFREVGSGINASSFMAAMLEGRKGAGAQDRMSDIEVIANSLTFILASYETSSTTTSLALLMLATHPEAQRRLLTEIDATAGREINHEMLAELPYTEAVLKETMRLYPAVPVVRHAMADIALGDGRTIPRGTFLALPNYNLHHNPALWPESERFLPERFMPPTKGLGGGTGGGGPTHPAAWAGFGIGARMCVGHKLATMIGKATLVSLLRRYTFTAAPNQAPRPPMATGLTYGPRGGVWLNAHVR